MSKLTSKLFLSTSMTSQDVIRKSRGGCLTCKYGIPSNVKRTSIELTCQTPPRKM